MGSVCPPPSLPGPNWGGLTSWPQLNWVVVPVASVSFPVSQGGLHSHCVQHCIVQAGCNQADESCISKNALRVFFFLHVEEMRWDTCAHKRLLMQKCLFFFFKARTQLEGPEPLRIFTICARWSVRLRRCDASPAVHALIRLAVSPCLAFAICGKRIQPRIKHPFFRDRRSDCKDVAARPFYLFNYSITRVAVVLISGL